MSGRPSLSVALPCSEERFRLDNSAYTSSVLCHTSNTYRRALWSNGSQVPFYYATLGDCERAAERNFCGPHDSNHEYIDITARGCT
jgi:hypothetical protein